jgi:hypothetical protein
MAAHLQFSRAFAIRDQPYRGGRQKHWINVKNRSHPAMERVLDSFR